MPQPKDEDTCDRCKKVFAWDEVYYRMEVVQRYQSQGYPDEFARNRLKFCEKCANEQWKNLPSMDRLAAAPQVAP